MMTASSTHSSHLQLGISGPTPARVQHAAPQRECPPVETLRAGQDGTTLSSTYPTVLLAVTCPHGVAVSHQPRAGMDDIRALENTDAGLMAGVCWHGSAPECGGDGVASARVDVRGAYGWLLPSSHEEGAAKTFSREESDMGLRGPRQYVVEVVADEAEEAEAAVDRLVRVVATSALDGRIDADEMARIRAESARAGREIGDVVHAAEVASIAQRTADNILRGEVAESTRQRGHDAGLVMPVWSVVEPRDAA